MTTQSNGRDDDKGFAIMSRHRYPVEMCRVFERTTSEQLLAALVSPVKPENVESTEGSGQGSNNFDASQGKQKGDKSTKPGESKKNINDGAHTKQPTLKIVLGDALGYGPALSEHIILDAGLIPSTKIGKDFKLDDDDIQLLVEAVTKFENWLEDVISDGKVPEGFILMQQKKTGRRDGTVCDSGSSEKVDFLSVELFVCS